MEPSFERPAIRNVVTTGGCQQAIFRTTCIYPYHILNCIKICSLFAEENEKQDWFHLA